MRITTALYSLFFSVHTLGCSNAILNRGDKKSEASASSVSPASEEQLASFKTRPFTDLIEFGIENASEGTTYANGYAFTNLRASLINLRGLAAELEEKWGTVEAMDEKNPYLIKGPISGQLMTQATEELLEFHNEALAGRVMVLPSKTRSDSEAATYDDTSFDDSMYLVNPSAPFQEGDDLQCTLLKTEVETTLPGQAALAIGCDPLRDTIVGAVVGENVGAAVGDVSVPGDSWVVTLGNKGGKSAGAIAGGAVGGNLGHSAGALNCARYGAVFDYMEDTTRQFNSRCAEGGTAKKTPEEAAAYAKAQECLVNNPINLPSSGTTDERNKSRDALAKRQACFGKVKL